MTKFKLDFDLVVLDDPDAAAALSLLKAGDPLCFREQGEASQNHSEAQVKGPVTVDVNEKGEIACEATGGTAAMQAVAALPLEELGGSVSHESSIVSAIVSCEEGLPAPDDRSKLDSEPVEPLVGHMAPGGGDQETTSNEGHEQSRESEPVVPRSVQPMPQLRLWQGTIGVQEVGTLHRLVGSVPPKVAVRLRPMLVAWYQQVPVAAMMAVRAGGGADQLDETEDLVKNDATQMASKSVIAMPVVPAADPVLPYRLTVRSVKRSKPDGIGGTAAFKVLLRVEDVPKVGEDASASQGTVLQKLEYDGVHSYVLNCFSLTLSLQYQGCGALEEKLGERRLKKILLAFY